MVAGLHHCDICLVRTQIWFQSKVWASQEGIYFTPLHWGPTAQTLPDMFYKSSITSIFRAERKQVKSVSVNVGSDFTCTNPLHFGGKNYSFVLLWHMHTIIFSSNFKYMYFSWRFKMDNTATQTSHFQQPHFQPFSIFWRTDLPHVCITLMNEGIFACVSCVMKQEGIHCGVVVSNRLMV